jgi:hypothetical protein
MEEVQTKHDYRYDYCVAIYTDINDTIRITCRRHGALDQSTKEYLRDMVVRNVDLKLQGTTHY